MGVPRAAMRVLRVVPGVGAWDDATGRHDPRFVGHAPQCAAIMFANVRTQEQLDGQWDVLERWAHVTAPLGDWLDWQQTYLLWSMKLAERAIGLRLELPAPDRAPG